MQQDKQNTHQKNPKVGEIYELCNTISPFNTQESWDKSGLNLGSFHNEYTDIVLCLEVNLAIALSLKPNTLLITHHPLFFNPTTQMITDTYPHNIAAILIRKNCSLISLHTNFDKSHLNTYLTHQILQWHHFVPSEDGLLMSGKIPPISLQKLAQDVCKKLNAPSVSFVQGDDITFLNQESQASHTNDTITEAYVVCGSGCSLLSQIHPNPHICLLTGDIKHHDAMMAKSMGISLIDIGHYESEKYFVEIFDSILQNVGYNAIIMDCKNPFYFCQAKHQ
ncbi:Nif3-like dinuclear metal center hexameric protein [Helicobacter sp. MIT 03-1614]|uniref:Nif3-like dinuclear metal center hexameric protein n=1 Tax=Helicobacter sp. MIT 03-1614 TaxID=1548147 RepID=UPI0006915045|nr:Nif3-like dinuclear metal center hexameric protein [Helicobacter sp. MIT 03-1614]TLD89991.1 Nif3-like dinuclear metal center hexameric protein [Helicobacter sp. MIT 03-1614]